MKRPVGIIILGILCLVAGGGGLFVPLDQPVVFWGMIHTGGRALVLHLVPNFVGLYLGYGILKPLQHTWYVYIIGACFSIVGLSFNLLHQAKIWEWHLLLESRTESIPRLVRFTIETHYFFIAIYALTAMYVYLQKSYFWGDRNL